jgi:hypothetical protein
MPPLIDLLQGAEMIRAAGRLSGLLICVVFLTAIPSNKSTAFHIGNPFKGVERALGSVARGVGNILGQGLDGLCAPTINTFADDVNKVLAERIIQADAMIGARITQIDGLMTNKLNQFDHLLQGTIQQFDALLDQKIGAVDIVATKAVQNAEDSLIAVLRYGAALFLIFALIFVVTKLVITRSPKEALSEPFLTSGFAAIAIAAAVAVGGSYVISPPAGAQIAKLTTNFQNAATTAYRHGEMNDASIYAKQLTVIDPTSIHFAAFQKVAEIQRDILYRPTTLKSVPGANEILPQISRLQQYTNDPLIKSSNDEFSKFIVEQASATSAVVLWQLAQDKELENEALCSAADAISMFEGSLTSKDVASVQTTATPFIWLSYSYLRWGAMVSRGSTSTASCEDKVALAKITADLEPTLAIFDQAEPPDSIKHVVTFNRAAVTYFAQASPMYTAIVIHDTAMQVLPGAADIAAHKAERDKLAERLMSLWSNFLSSTMSDPSISFSDIGIGAIGLPAALAYRAQLVRDVPGAGARHLTQPVCAAVINDVNTLTPDQLKAKYEAIHPPGEPAAAAQIDAIYHLALVYQSKQIRNLICSEQVAIDNSLSTTEASLTAAAKKPLAQELSDRQLIAKDGVLTSLAACKAVGTEPSPWTGHPVCSDSDFGAATPIQTQPYTEWLASIGPLPTNNVRYAMVR